MTLEEMIEIFDELSNDYNRKTRWELTDIDGFIRLRELGWSNPGSIVDGVQSMRSLISYAKREEIWLSVDPEWLASVATREDIEYLHDCHIHYDYDADSLHMFV